MKKIVILTGPTGVGKTSLSIKIAHKFKVPIINADAFQVYQDMEILTASPTRDEKAQVDHRFFNILSPDETFSIYDYQTLIRKEIDEEVLNQPFAFLVGGSGLYINSIIYDYQLTPNKRAQINSDLTDLELYEKLVSLDQEAAKLVHPNNRKRIMRAIELASANEFKYQQTDKLYYDALVIVLNTDRSTLYQKIDERVDEMVTLGLLGEVEKLLERELSITARQAIGYKELVPYFNGEQSLETALNQIKQNSRHLAKRQLTWFKNKLKAVFVNKNDDSEEVIINLITSFLKEDHHAD